MRFVDNEKGSVLVFITLMIVLLMIMVGMGLDTGQLTYTRSQGQAAVDAAALSAVSGLPLGAGEVTARVAAFNANNDYLSSSLNPIAAKNITYINYDHTTDTITNLPDITNANGVRVALEKTNPYTSAAAGTAMQSPVFLTPLMRLFGNPTAPAKVDVSVSAVAALRGVPSIPIAIMEELCKNQSASDTGENPLLKLRQSNALDDNSCWTTYKENPPSASAVKARFVDSGDCSGLPQDNAVLVPGKTPIELDNGQQAATYDAAADLFLDPKHAGRWWLVPIIPTTTKCNQTDTFLGWASIQVSAVEKQGSPKYIEANVKCGQHLWQINNNYCLASRLLRDTKSGM
jgi:Flp pilus assembly protein TadG